MSKSANNGFRLKTFLRAGLAGLFALFPGKLLALDPARSIFQYNCQTWWRQNGLSANGINSITQTKDGHLWLGTSAGLVRFDGNEFKAYNKGQAPSARSIVVMSVSAARHGGLWFGMERGSFGFCDGADVSMLGREEWGGLNMNIHSLLESREGDVWIAAETGAARLIQGKSLEPILSLAEGKSQYDVTAMCQDSKGRIWLGTSRRGMFCWENGKLSKVPDPKLDELVVQCLTEDREGHIWAGTQLGLICYNEKFEHLPFPSPWYSTRTLLADRHGVLWIGTASGGLARYLNGNLTQFRKVDGLADDFVVSLAEDDEGSLWVGTRNGLSQLSDVKIPTYGKGEGLSGDINVAVSGSRRGGIWVATSDGLAYFDGVAASFYGKEVGLKEPYINGIFEASSGEVYLIEGKMDVEIFSEGKIVASYPHQTWPTGLAEDAHGVVLGVAGNLFRIGKDYYAPYPFENGEKPSINWIFHMTKSRDGSILVGGDTGLCRIRDGKFALFGPECGLADTKVTWVCEDDEGTLWLGHETGISRLKNGVGRAITRKEGLFDDIINAIVPDDHGSLWVDSGRGFFRVSRQSMNDLADGKINRIECKSFTGLDAVKNSEKYLQKPSGCKTPDGRIWFPTAQGVVMIDPTNLTANPVPPKVHIDTVKANGRELPRGVFTEVRPGSGDLEFQYAGLNYIAPLKTQYRYRLEGYDKDWVSAGARRSAFYMNLKPAEYTFQVQACNEDGVWNTTGASYSLRLLPHVYQSWWFVTLCGLALLGGLFGIYGWRVKRLTWKQQQLQASRDLLEAKVTERTAELADSNRSLKSEIEERERMQREVERVHRELLAASRQAGQAEVASSVLHNVGNVLNSINVSTGLLSDRIRALRLASLAKVAEMLRANSNDLSRYLTEDPKGRQLPQYLENLAKHLGQEQNDLLGELKGLTQNVEHVKEIVAMQQNYAKVSGLHEATPPPELVESALKMHAGGFQRHGLKLVRDFEITPPVVVDKHKVLQILVNLLQNAKNACDESGREDKRVAVRICKGVNGTVKFEIADNGIGIPQENLARIFRHGFTTKKHGHGFGLHSSALAANEMGGTLTGQSDGPNKGATFILELPMEPKKAAKRIPAMAG